MWNNKPSSYAIQKAGISNWGASGDWNDLLPWVSKWAVRRAPVV